MVPLGFNVIKKCLSGPANDCTHYIGHRKSTASRFIRFTNLVRRDYFPCKRGSSENLPNQQEPITPLGVDQ